MTEPSNFHVKCIVSSGDGDRMYIQACMHACVYVRLFVSLDVCTILYPPVWVPAWPRETMHLLTDFSNSVPKQTVYVKEPYTTAM